MRSSFPSLDTKIVLVPLEFLSFINSRVWTMPPVEPIHS
jgi:hypothetical protein